MNTFLQILGGMGSVFGIFLILLLIKSLNIEDLCFGVVFACLTALIGLAFVIEK